MIEAIAKIAESIADATRSITNWGSWAGSIILAVGLSVWGYLCIHRNEWIDPGATAGLLLFAIYALLSRKPKPADSSTPPPTEPPAP